MITAFLCPTPSSTRQFYVAAENDLYLVLPPQMRKLQEETKFRIGASRHGDISLVHGNART